MYRKHKETNQSNDSNSDNGANDDDMNSDENDCIQSNNSGTVNCDVESQVSNSQERSALFLLKAREEKMINQVTLNSLTKDITGQS